MEIEISHLDALSPTDIFGKVGKAMEVFSGGDDRFRCQIIELPPGKSFDPHLHISVHIIYVIEGRGFLNTWNYEANGEEVMINQNSKKCYRVSKGDLFIIPKDVVHAMSASEDEKLKELIINIPGIALHDHRRIIWR
jgi:quercetin dioxygenase-like cupin family protein